MGPVPGKPISLSGMLKCDAGVRVGVMLTVGAGAGGGVAQPASARRQKARIEVKRMG